MHLSTYTSLFLSILTATTLALPEPQSNKDTGRPCGFKIAPCPASQTCKKTDPACTRGENCAGTCVVNRHHSSPTPIPLPSPLPSSIHKPSTTSSSPSSTPTYQSCGGHRANAPLCGEGEICVDDPRVGGCGQACDMAGICVKPVFCGGFAAFKCKEDLLCVDDPRDDCDPKNGGADCGGICV